MSTLPGFTAEAIFSYRNNFHALNTVEQHDMFLDRHRIVPQIGIPDIPVYGNYCGPGHGDSTFQKPPVDAVDAVCKRHDWCYSENGLGRHHCTCERKLLSEMFTAISSTKTSFAGKVAGRAIMQVFAVKPCVCQRWVTFRYPCTKWCKKRVGWWRAKRTVYYPCGVRYCTYRRRHTFPGVGGRSIFC